MRIRPILFNGICEINCKNLVNKNNLEYHNSTALTWATISGITNAWHVQNALVILLFTHLKV